MGTASTRPNSFNQRYKQPFQSRGLRSRFGDAICYNCGKKGHTYYYCRSRPDPRVPRRVVIDRVIFSLKVKEVLVGNLISWETKTRPCLVAK